MPRYVADDGRAFQIELAGRTLAIDGKVQAYVNPAEARDAYLALVQRLAREGFALDGSDDDEPDDDGDAHAARLAAVAQRMTHPELLAAIAAAPDDPAAYAVFADFLQGGSDPWGTLIALELADKDASGYLDRMADGILLDLSDPWRQRDVELTWRWGFIRKARIKEPDRGASCSHAELTRRLLAHRAAAIVERVELFRGTPQLDVVRASPQAARLRELSVFGNLGQLELARLATELPALERLEVADMVVSLRLAHPRLRHLRMWDCERFQLVPTPTDCPRLAIAEIAGAEPLASRIAVLATSAPALEELGLAVANDAVARTSLARLVASPLGSRIRRLVLRFASKPTIAALAEHAAYLAGLEQVRLAGTRPLVRARDAIAAAVPNLRFG